MRPKNSADYTPARLQKLRVGGREKWCIRYAVRNPETGKLVYYRYWGRLNRLNQRERKTYAAEACSQINEALARGWNPTVTDTAGTLTLADAIRRVLDSLEGSLRPDSLKDYKSRSKVFLEWLLDQGRAEIMPDQLSQKDLYAFLDYLSTSRNVGGRTRNNYRTNLAAIFAKLQDRGILEDNPWRGIKRVPQDMGRNLAYTPGQASQLWAWLETHRPQAVAFMACLYWGFLRPKEIRRLRVQDVDLAARQVLVRAEIAKNRRQAHVFIGQTWGRLLAALLTNYPPGGWYLFGRGFVPGAQELDHKAAASAMQQALKAAGLQGQGYTVYSWKHTGVVAAYRRGVDLKSIQQQCRHASITETDTYLKTLGLNPGQELASKEW